MVLAVKLPAVAPTALVKVAEVKLPVKITPTPSEMLNEPGPIDPKTASPGLMIPLSVGSMTKTLVTEKPEMIVILVDG